MNKNFENLLTEAKIRKFSSRSKSWKYSADADKLELYSQKLIKEVINVIWKNKADPEIILALQRYYDVLD